MQTNHGRTVRVQFYGTREIRAALGIGKTKAVEIMHMFEQRGQIYMIGNRYKVRAQHFEDWLENEARRRWK